jgi:hypothetical protein
MMKWINASLKAYMKSRLFHIDFFRNNPIETQQRVYKQLIYSGKHTLWGKTYKYASIETYQQFAEQVPLQTYEQAFPYIERVLKGEKDVLWPGKVKWFSKSSGTTNDKSKYIPVTNLSLDETHYRGGKDLIACYFENTENSQLFSGKSLAIGGSYSASPYRSNSYIGDVSAVIMANLPSWAQFSRTPSIQDATLADWETKLQVFAQKTKNANVTNLAGVPTWTVLLMEKMMYQNKVQNMLEIWPCFEAFFHGGVSFTPYRSLFQKFFPSNSVRYVESYNASEGYFGIQDDLSKSDFLLLTDHGIFYEFIPMEEADIEYPMVLTLEQVTIGQVYSLVISSNAGLWRYKIGDTIEFTSIHPFRYKIAGRTKHFINAFGEELMVENADIAVAEACIATGAAIKDYTAAPIYLSQNGKGGHEWLMEFAQMPNDMNRFIQTLDATLKRVNSDYEAKRQKDLALVQPIVIAVPEKTFYAWLSSKGKLGGQHKVPRLSNDRTIVEEIKKLTQ